MERIRLSKGAKAVFRLLDKGIYQRPYDMNIKEYNLGALELSKCGLAVCHQESNGDVIVAQLTDYGKLYISRNPGLSNPIDWVRVGAIVSAIAAIISIIALFVACKALNNHP